MTKSSTPASSVTETKTQHSSSNARVMPRVEKFPIAQPKFTKESWSSGEGEGL